MEVERLLGWLVVLAVRYQLIGQARTGKLNARCARVARRIWDRELESASDTWDALVDLVPDNEQFRKDFALFESTKTAQVGTGHPGRQS